MGNYEQTAEMKGEKPFRCYNCGKLLILDLGGTDYELMLHCPRCKAKINVTLQSPIPDELDVKLGSLVEPLAKK